MIVKLPAFPCHPCLAMTSRNPRNLDHLTYRHGDSLPRSAVCVRRACVITGVQRPTFQPPDFTPCALLSSVFHVNQNTGPSYEFCAVHKTRILVSKDKVVTHHAK
jgi:hypothetical protein